MKKVDEILGKTENGLPQPSWTSKTSTGNRSLSTPEPEAPQRELISQETKAMVNMVFARFMAIYGHKFKSAFETEQEIMIAKREWAMSISGYGENELVSAINRCKETLAWMPSISEFLGLLKEVGADFGLPSSYEAYQEACRYAGDHHHDWSHPAVYEAAKQTGWYEIRGEAEANIYPRFRYYYDMISKRVRAGEAIDQPVSVAIEDKSEVTHATTMLEFAKTHQIDEAEACKLLYYLTLPEGSNVRSRQYQQSLVTAQNRGWTLPTTQ
ncbi:MAG: replication protein P [Marinobacterium sp.]|jgi:hypothetical protein